MTDPVAHESYRLLGDPRPGGILIVADHASNHVPADIDLGIAPGLLNQHIAIDIGVAGVAQRMVEAGAAAYVARISRLVCDFNRHRDSPGIVPETSDGHAIPGNVLSPGERERRIARFYDPYHARLASLLEEVAPALIVSLHSFTPLLASAPNTPRPWHVGVLYGEDERAARLAIPLLEADGLTVGDQEPYSGKLLNATMNRHAETAGRLYLGVEIRQDQIVDEAGQAVWAKRLWHVASQVAAKLA